MCFGASQGSIHWDRFNVYNGRLLARLEDSRERNDEYHIIISRVAHINKTEIFKKNIHCVSQIYR